MEYLRVVGERKLNGKVKIKSAKNALLPIMACAILLDGEVVIKDVPPLIDVLAMMRIIVSTGGRAYFNDGDLVINCSDSNPQAITSALTGCIRSSIFILGPIIGRFKKAEISYPGGCDIGARPIDLHIKGLRSLGVKITEENERIVCDGKNLKGAEITLDFPSVGATENIMMASVLSKGRTTIYNCAREPEIVDLGNFILSLGGKVYGHGSKTIVIEGVERLNGTCYKPIADRIVAGSYLTACAIAGGDIALECVNSRHLTEVIKTLQLAGVEIEEKEGELRAISNGQIKAVKEVETKPFPGFPTDMQPQIVAMLSRANGQSKIIENLFENRYKYALQLQKMGVNLQINGKTALINGGAKTHGASVFAEDLRGGAALVLSALGAEGESKIFGVEHIDRGYFQIEEDLSSLGADIRRIIS